MRNRGDRSRYILLMALCAGLWSIGGLFIKLLPWNALVITGMRSLIASGVVYAYMRVRGHRVVASRGSLLTGALLGLTTLLYVSSNKLTTSANAIVLQFTSPIFIMLLSALFLKQRFRRGDYVVVAATFAGITLCFVGHMTPGGTLGNLIAVGNGVLLAGVYVLGGHIEARARMSGILFGHLFAAAAGLACLPAFPPRVTPASVAVIAVLGVFQLGIPYVLYGIAAEGCPPLMISLVGVIEPLLNPVWVFLFTGEAPGPLALAGEFTVLASVTLWCAWDARTHPPANPAREETPRPLP